MAKVLFKSYDFDFLYLICSVYFSSMVQRRVATAIPPQMDCKQNTLRYARPLSKFKFKFFKRHITQLHDLLGFKHDDRHDMEMLSTLQALCAGNPLLLCGFSAKSDQWCTALMFSLLLAWTSCQTNSPVANDLTSWCPYDVTVTFWEI